MDNSLNIRYLIDLKTKRFINQAKLLYDTFQIKPLLYGSLGLEVLLNESLASDDIDILIPKVYLEEKWSDFKSFLEENGYTLIDEHEHTFLKDKVAYAYASIEELETFANIKLDEIKQNEFYQELNLRQFLRVYHSSIKDGYRINHRQKKDQDKIDMICQSLVSLVEPSMDMLEYKQKLISDFPTMSYNHQTIEFPKERWQDWYNRWIGNKDPNYFYRYLYSHEYKAFIGEIAYHLVDNCFVCDILIEHKYRHQLFGLIGLDMLSKSAKDNGILELYDYISKDNPSIHLFLKNGFDLLEITEKDFVVRKKLS